MGPRHPGSDGGIRERVVTQSGTMRACGRAFLYFHPLNPLSLSPSTRRPARRQHAASKDLLYIHRPSIKTVSPRLVRRTSCTVAQPSTHPCRQLLRSRPVLRRNSLAK